MLKPINLVGKKFGRLIVIQRVDNDQWGHLYWLCRCTCGIEKIIAGHSLKNGDTKSCGCLRKEKLIKRLTRHGHTKNYKSSKTYKS